MDILKKIVCGLAVLILFGSLMGGWSLLVLTLFVTAIKSQSLIMFLLVIATIAVTGLFVQSIIEKMK